MAASAPKISVCLDVFNYARFLPQAIESVLCQTCVDFELLIQDDASSDGSFEIAQDYASRDRRIVAVRNPANLGMVGNRNTLLQRARGEFVKFLHADDFLLLPDALERMAAILAPHPSVAMVASATQNVDELGGLISVSRHWHAAKAVSGTSVIRRCLRDQRNLIGGPTAVMVRRALAGRGFDPQLSHAADLEMWFHLLEQGAFIWLDESLCAYRWHANQQTEKDKGTLDAARDLREILTRYLDKPYVDLPRPLKRFLRDSAERDLYRQSTRLGRDPEGQRHPLLPLANFEIKQWRFVERHVIPRFRPGSKERAPGVNVIGFLSGQYGIGSSSRAWADAARLMEVSTALLNIRSKVHSNRDDSFGTFSKTNPYRANLMTFSADYARRFRRDMGQRFFSGRKNVALWYWEVERFPCRWHNAFDWHDEIWVATRFCEESLRAVSPVPVHRIPYPYRGGMAAPNRERFGIAPDQFAFLFNFDFLSVVERKNPQALVAAFRRAFRRDDNAVLLMKTINSERAPEQAAAFREAIRDLNVIWIEPHLSGAEMEQLFASCDCYASLHRSEGLGLGMIQAMWYGKPVIATGWSGNLDFMTPENGMLVRYELRELQRDYGPYERGNRWAEADVQHAAEWMRWTFENPDRARLLGEQAAETIRRELDPARCAGMMKERLKALGGIA